MVGAIVATAAALLLFASAAAAARWGERPFMPSRGNSGATCMRSAGPDGQIAVTGPLHRRSLDIDFLRATPAGLRRDGHARIPPPEFDCPAVSAADGTAVVASFTFVAPRGLPRVVASVRDAGGRFGRARTVSRGFGFATQVEAAAGAGGDVTVIWVEEGGRHTKLRVARRHPNGSFGAPVTLATFRGNEDEVPEPQPVVGVDAAGTTTVAWTVGRFSRSSLLVTSARRNGAFGHPRRVARRLSDAEGPSLTVAPSGRALIAVDTLHAIRLFERRTAAARFRRLRAFRAPRRNELYGSSTSLANDGTALVAWQFAGGRVYGVRASTRTPGRGFGPPKTLEAEHFGSSFFISAIGTSGGAPQLPDDFEAGALRTALGADGHELVTWLTDTRTRGGDTPNGVRAALGSTSAGFDRPAVLRSPCRGVENEAAAELATGGVATVFDDNDFRVEQGGFSKPRRAGRVHLALPGIAGPLQAAPPRVHVSVRRPRKPLGFQKPLRARVRCSAACDVRLFVPSKRGFPRALGSVTLSHAGVRSARVDPYAADNVAPRHGHSVRVVAHACPRGGTRFSSDSSSVAVRRAAPPRLPRLRGVKAVRNGRKVVVVWHTRRPAGNVGFWVQGQNRRGRTIAEADGRPLSAYHFKAEMRDPKHHIRRVVVTVQAERPPNNQRSVTVRVH
jgi:hypothetical protein